MRLYLLKYARRVGSSDTSSSDSFVRGFLPRCDELAQRGQWAHLGWGFKQHHCATKILGRTLTRRLTRRQRHELFFAPPACNGRILPPGNQAIAPLNTQDETLSLAWIGSFDRDRRKRLVKPPGCGVAGDAAAETVRYAGAVRRRAPATLLSVGRGCADAPALQS